MPHKLSGHKNAVCALAVGQDGRVYSGACDETIMIWSAKTGEHVRKFRSNTTNFRALAIGHNGKIYGASWNKLVKVWPSARGARGYILEGHTDKVTSLAVGHDGVIYSGSEDCTVRVWSGDNGAHLQTLVGHTGSVNALVVGKDGAICSGSSDDTIKVWSGHDGILLRTLPGTFAGDTQRVSPYSGVTSLAVGPDGKLYAGSGDATVHVWSSDTGTHLLTFTVFEGCRDSQVYWRAGSDVVAIAVGPDGTVFSALRSAYSSGFGTFGCIAVSSGETGALLHTLSSTYTTVGMMDSDEWHTDNVRCLAVGPDGTLYSGHHSGKISMWR